MTAKSATRKRNSKIKSAKSFLELDPQAHLQAIGFYDQVDQAFAALTAEIAAKAEEVRTALDKQFSELEASS